MRPMHIVATHEEARALVDGASFFAVSNCGCRESRGGCARSKPDMCLMLVDREPSGSGKRTIGRDEVLAHLAYAHEHRLVARPYRDDATRTRVEGICFCCDDCCGYFRDMTEACERGSQIEHTNLAACDDCGSCADVCHFGARTLPGGRLKLDREACFGCGLCVEVCPTSCIKMLAR